MPPKKRVPSERKLEDVGDKEKRVKLNDSGDDDDDDDDDVKSEVSSIDDESNEDECDGKANLKEPKTSGDEKPDVDENDENDEAEEPSAIKDENTKNGVVKNAEVNSESKCNDGKTEDPKPKSDSSETLGTLLVCGGTNWDLIGRKELPKAAKGAAQNQNTVKNLWGPHRWSKDIKVKAVVSSCTACHSVLVTEEGRAMTWGRNDRGQLGHSDLVTRYDPTVVETLKNHKIVSAATGKGHTLFLTQEGVVYSCGDNKMGQLGIGTQSQNVVTPTRISYTGKPIVRMACGAEFSMIVDNAGGLFSFGSPEYGQLGHNSEGKYFTSGNKLAYQCETTPRRVVVFVEKTREGHIIPLEDVIIKDVAAGVNHALAVDTKKRCFSWGFGGYGRLGHNETKNELMPRNIKTFDVVNRGVMRVWAGGMFCMALDESGLLYFWGQNKTSGEATMYPKTVQDLCGWNVRCVACANRSIVVVADDSLISWGPSPTYGELGYGENKAKSSTTPQEVKPLDGMHVLAVSCGYGHTLMICRNDSEEDKKLVNKLPQWP